MSRGSRFSEPAIFYEGETSVANLRRNFPDVRSYQDYERVRLDSFHQFLYPQHSSAGSRSSRGSAFAAPTTAKRAIPPAWFSCRRRDDPLIPDFLLPPPAANMPLRARRRSFAHGRERRRRGVLQGLAHLGDSAEPRPRSRWPAPHHAAFHEFLLRRGQRPRPRRRSSSSIATSLPPSCGRSISRSSLRSIRSTTGRSRASACAIASRPGGTTSRSTGWNWKPTSTSTSTTRTIAAITRTSTTVSASRRVPWVGLGITSQIPLLGNGFTEVNTGHSLPADRQSAAQLRAPFPERESVLRRTAASTRSAPTTASTITGRAGAYGRYEAITGIVEEQRYSIYRDLTSWVASLGAVIRNNGGVKEYGVLVDFHAQGIAEIQLRFELRSGRARRQTVRSRFPMRISALQLPGFRPFLPAAAAQSAASSVLMDLSIIGSGYVGLVTGACFADVGHNVICVDNDPRKVEALQAGKVPIYEPGLEEVIHRNVAAQRLRFTGSIKDGVDNSQVVFIAVPTPQQRRWPASISASSKKSRAKSPGS